MALATPLSGSLPGRPALPLLGWRGNALLFFRDPLRFMRTNYLRYGPIAAMVRGDPRSVFAIGPEYNRQLLSDARLFNTVFETLTPERFKRRSRSRGLLRMNGEEHKQNRRLMQPAFHRKHIETFRDDMVALTERMLDGWQVGQSLDIAHAMQQLTLRVACKTLFGLDITGQSEGLGRLIKRLLATPFFSPAIAWFPFDLPGTPYRRMMVDSALLEQEILALIARRRADPDEHGDVLAMLIRARDEDGTGLTDAALLGHTNTLLIAGHETSSNALSWTLLLLAQHPRVLADLLDELAGTLRGAAPAVEQLGRLPLLDRVVKESMRLLPPASFSSRISTAPFALGPYELPEGALVTFSQFLTHRLPELYPDPQRFCPERWERIDPSPYEYLPFGAGPRMCIGAAFALMEIKIVLAMLLQRFRPALPPGTRVDYQVKITLSPRGELPMVLAEREQPPRRTDVRGTIRDVVDFD